MTSSITIPHKRSAPLALDHEQLFNLGLQHVQRLASRIWTDYNVHDPGITILELLCYALTDLSYRASFPLADLLASPADNAAQMQEQFFTARQILPNRPLTLLDYRKLLIDLPGVQNAWLQPASLNYYADVIKGKLLRQHPSLPGIQPVPLRGLYQVSLEFMDDVTDPARRQEIKAAARQLLMANRNLGEDFVSITEVQSQPFLLCTEVELTPAADTARVQADILFQVQHYLAPPPVNYTLSEMLTRTPAGGAPYTAAEIFDGPLLECGFFADDELQQADLRTEIRLADIINLIMDLPGVLAVRDLVVLPASAPAPAAKDWVVPVAPGKKALLNRDLSRLVFYKGVMPVVPPAAAVDDHLAQLVAAARAKAETPASYDLPVPVGRFRQPDAYFSFQNHFPALYGLSKVGLSQADAARLAQAHQLKAYLLFFDQLMANYCAQLSHVKDLFALDPELHRTYFYRVVDSFAAFNQIYATPDPVATMENQVEAPDPTLDRRQRFLDHLIARFAERFHDFAAIMHASCGADPATLVRYKCDFLQNYPEISCDRALAYNYGLDEAEDLWDTDNVSGLEKRLARLLGLPEYRRRNLAAVNFDAWAEVSPAPGGQFGFQVRRPDTNEVLLEHPAPFASQDAAREAALQAIQYAQLPSSYASLTTPEAKHTFQVLDGEGEVLARHPGHYDTPEARDAARNTVREYLRTHCSEEGIYVVENILLRPATPVDPFLPICPDPACTTCPGADPYSYRLHIILPAYAVRFRQAAFRQFAEAVIRAETPAHLLPKICWINRDEMELFEKVYRDWLHLKARGDATPQRQARLQAFIDVLFSVRNVYETQKLHDCEAGEGKPHFILGRSSLGSFTPDGD